MCEFVCLYASFKTRKSIIRNRNWILRCFFYVAVEKEKKIGKLHHLFMDLVLKPLKNSIFMTFFLLNIFILLLLMYEIFAPIFSTFNSIEQFENPEKNLRVEIELFIVQTQNLWSIWFGNLEKQIRYFIQYYFVLFKRRQHN